MNIGFIGLGIMGKPMSKNLLKAGYSLMVLDLNRDVMDELASLGAEKAANPKEVAENCRFVITMLGTGRRAQGTGCKQHAIFSFK